MKKLYKYIVFVIGILAFSACADEELVGSFGETGSDVILNLSLKPEITKEIVNSRATEDENKLYDLHIYVFEPPRVVNGIQTGGTLIGYEQLDFGDDGMIHLNEPNTYSVNVRTKTGEAYIYALANINQDETYYLDNNTLELLNVTGVDVSTVDMSKEEILSIVEASDLNLEVFKEIQFLRKAGNESQWFSPTPKNKYMMSGYSNNGQTVTIQKDENGNGYGSIVETDKVIKLYRILAKNTLTIDWSQSRGKFTPKYYRLCEVPTKGMLIPNANINTAYGEDDDVYLTEANVTNTLNQNIPTISTYRENLKLTPADEQAKSIVLTFHYPENLRSFERNDDIIDWNDREVNDYSSGSKVFTNAPDKSAYIEIHGDYVDNAGNLTANVSYTIHLGNFSQKKNPVNNPTLYATLNAKRMSDFNVVRNHSYIYNVYINGVNDVIAEAMDQHNNPYAEGLVIYTGKGKQYELDAHYEARVMAFDKNTMVTLKGSNVDIQPGYVVNISTPFGNTPKTLMVKQKESNGQLIPQICNLKGEELATVNPDGTLNKVVDDEVIFEGEEDYTWMTFVKNTENNRTSSSNDISKYTCKFPVPDDSNNPKLNVFQLLAELYNTDGNVYDRYGKVYYTCFIDEYYYNDRSWTEYTNKPKRSMQIAINKEDLYVSEDSKSVYAEVAYGISQRSISTFYNNVNRANIIAFGTENVDEEDIYDNKNPNNLSETDSKKTRLGNNSSNDYYKYFNNLVVTDPTPDYWDGWTNAKNAVTGRPWYSTEGSGNSEIPIVIKEGVQPLYRAAAKACMSRNRDLNGDENIDEDEIRWYLASVEQYRALFFGQSVLEEDVRLFGSQEDVAYFNGLRNNGNYYFNERGAYHYWTSSGTSAGTFWPEEGMTDNIAGRASWGVCRAELVRCVRTLGNGNSSNTEFQANGLMAPDEYFVFGNDNDNPYEFLDDNEFYLDAITVTRVNSSDPLPEHNEVSLLWNDFTASFAVAKNFMSRTNYSSSDAKGDDPCESHNEDGYEWRMPNQKEFALMLSRMNYLGLSTSEYYLTRTNYSLGWHPSNYGIFGYDAGSINLTNHPNRAKIRCVRDIDISTRINAQ